MKRKRMSGIKGFVKSKIHRLKCMHGGYSFSVPHEINTVAGVAAYDHTEHEDEYGRWNDNYYTRDGFYVIHDGRMHHVYKLKK